jgi:hypothetical protein
MNVLVIVVVVVVLVGLALSARIVTAYEQGCCSGWAGSGARGHPDST